MDDISKTNALLYGSSKKMGLLPYLLTSCYYNDTFVDNVYECLGLIIQKKKISSIYNMLIFLNFNQSEFFIFFINQSKSSLDEK